MIIEDIVRTCPECSSENIVKNGHDYKGAQKYHCHACGSYGTLDKKTDTMNEQNDERRMPILNG
ncbi:MAG: IS1 family transposase [Caldilineales bacterium]|nr:IS1 family transposase [Caldilineales bacterium]